MPDDYEVEGQMNLDDCLWEMGYYMPLPEGEDIDERETYEGCSREDVVPRRKR